MRVLDRVCVIFPSNPLSFQSTSLLHHLQQAKYPYCQPSNQPLPFTHSLNQIPTPPILSLSKPKKKNNPRTRYCQTDLRLKNTTHSSYHPSIQIALPRFDLPPPVVSPLNSHTLPLPPPCLYSKPLYKPPAQNITAPSPPPPLSQNTLTSQTRNPISRLNHSPNPPHLHDPATPIGSSY